MSVAIVLGGAGTRGDFQIGAMWRLVDRGITPNIICGASGGAIIGAKLAEGAGSLYALEETWSNLSNDQDVYLWEPWLLSLRQEVRQILRLVTEAIERYAVFPPLFVLDAILLGVDVAQLVHAAQQASMAKALFNFTPLVDQLRAAGTSGSLDAEKVRNSGIELRLSTVDLEKAKLHYVTELGQLIDDDGVEVEPAIDLINGVIASATVPGIFSPVKLNGRGSYVDGGLRELAPVRPAIELGADEVYVIYPRPGAVFDPAHPSYDNDSLIEIGGRALDIGLDEIRRNDVDPGGGWDGAIVTTIQASFDVHESLTIDPGLIYISMGYGYMRASDIIDGSPRGEQRVNELKSLSDAITRLRMECWDLEYRANGVDKPPKLTLAGPRLQETVPLPDPTSLRHVRGKKREIRELVQSRLNLNGAVPNDVEVWWREWERHPWPTYTANPWDEFSSRAGYVEAEAPPPAVFGKAPVPIASNALLLLEEEKAPVPIASIVPLLLGD